MKMKLFVIVSAVAMLLGSCDGYWAGRQPVGAREFGTVREKDGEMYVVLDKNGAYSPDGMDDLLYRLVADKDGQRVITAYYFEEDTKLPGDLLNVYKVLTKDIFTMVPAAEDSIGNSRVEVENAWISGGHVNVQFSYYGSGMMSHFINLVVPSEGDETAEKYEKDGYKYLEFRHNAFDDRWIYWYEDYVSFPVDWDLASYNGCCIGYTNYYGQKVVVEVRNSSPATMSVPGRSTVLE